MPSYVAAIDQGTASTRFMVFDHEANVIAVDERDHEQLYPRPGWVEMDPLEILARTRKVVRVTGTSHSHGTRRYTTSDVMRTATVTFTRLR